MTKTLQILIFFGWFCITAGCSVEDNEQWLVRDDRTAPVSEPNVPKETAAVGVARPASTECGLYNVSKVYPIKLDIVMPEEVSVGKTFTHTISVTNLAETALENIVLNEPIAEDFKLVAATEGAKRNAYGLTWIIESLRPNESRQVLVVGAAKDAKCLARCATVTCSLKGCAWTRAVEPKILLSKNAPAEALICEPIIAEYILTNSGSGTASDLKIVDALPANITTTDGAKSVSFRVDTLGPGQTSRFSARLRAQKTGRYSSKAVATSADGLSVESAATATVVRQPVLTITKTGPRRHFLGRPVSYDITVTNKGDAPAANVVVEDTIPAGVTSARVSAVGTISGSKAVWRLGTIPVNGSKKVTVFYSPNQAGTLGNVATASAYCAAEVSASASTEVIGIPAVLLEVMDLVDPVEVGGQTTYVITTTNQGSMAGTDIRIVCMLEENEQFVSASGATTGTAEGGTVTFAPLRSLAPKAKATWRIVVKAVKAGDVRFKVAMNTGEFERPVEETEATHLYE